MASTIATPPHTITVKNGDTQQDIFMSFGLLNRLTRHLGSVDQLPALAMDPELQEIILLEVFTVRDKSGTATKVPAGLDDLEVSLEDVDLILDFVGDHIANFFVQATEKAQKRVLSMHGKLAGVQEKLSSLMPIKAGSSL